MISRAQIDDLAAEKLDIGFIRLTHREQATAPEPHQILREPIVIRNPESIPVWRFFVTQGPKPAVFRYWLVADEYDHRGYAHRQS